MKFWFCLAWESAKGMFIVGLTGGVATGKSSVSRMLKEEGAYIIDADQIAKELVEPHSPAWNEIQSIFGQEILSRDDLIDRKKLAAIVFSSPEKRKLLSRILHPRIKKEMARRVNAIGQKDPQAIVVIDAPLLVETGYHREMERVILVLSTEMQQIERLRNRDGMDPEDARKIISSQMPLKEKMKVADFIIENEGSLEEARRRVKEIFQELRGLAMEKKRGG